MELQKDMNKFFSTEVNNDQSKTDDDLLIAFPVAKGTKWETK